ILGARDATLRAELLETILTHEAERDGDYDRLAAAWLDAVPAHAEDPRIELLFRRLGTILPRLAEPEKLLEPLESLVDRGILRSPSRELALAIVGGLEARRGRYDEAFGIAKRQGATTSFLVAGPFGRTNGGDLRRAYGPEESLEQLDRVFRDGPREIAW